MHHRKIVKRRRQLVDQDGGQRCYYCGAAFSPGGKRHQTLDHLVPESRGGTHELINLVLACARCNGAKGDMTVTEFEATAYLQRRRRIMWAEDVRQLRWGER